MIFLNESLYINTGTNRICYKDPSELSRCLKIDIKKNHETIREVTYYKRLLENKISFSMLAKYYGPKNTNLGKAECFELIKDFEGSISNELDKYLKDEKNSLEEIERMLKYVPLLKDYIFKNKIYVKDLNTVNIMYQINKDNKNRLVIIDGLSHSNYNPLFYVSNYFILKKIKLSWNKFIKSFKKQDIIENNPVLLKYLKKF